MNTKPSTPILIAGPTASGKSSLGLALAAKLDGVVINADALQVYVRWNILSARPGDDDMARAPHRLYGHVDDSQLYSVGHWLIEVQREIKAALAASRTPIILGGTGLYFTTLTSGLAPIPQIPETVRAAGNTLREERGCAGFIEELARLDPETLGNTDQNNPMRLQRAWEVFTATGRGLVEWQRATPEPALRLEDTIPILLNCDRNWLNDRIAVRTLQMIRGGAIDECRQALEAGWDPGLASSQAIGAAEIVRYLTGDLTLEEATELVVVKTQQYAKRQRTWFRSKMKDWIALDPASGTLVEDAMAVVARATANS